MTTFHEPPAQSRRAARQSERGEDPQFAPQTGIYAPPSEPLAVVPPLEQTAQPEGLRPPAASSGRRARARAEGLGLYDVPTVPPSDIQSGLTDQGEPLTYLTQGLLYPGETGPATPSPAYAPSNAAPSSTVPVYDVPAGDAHTGDAHTLSLAERLQQASTVAAAIPAEPAPEFRVRDFSPEGGRRAARAAEAVVSEAPLSYQTQQAPEQPVHHMPVQHLDPVQHQDPVQPQAPAQHVPAQSATPTVAQAAGYDTSFVEHTLTRRELRALHAEQDAASGLHDLAEVPPLIEPETRSSQSTATALSHAMAEFEALARDAQAKTAATQPPLNYDPVNQPFSSRLQQTASAAPVELAPLAPGFVGLAPPDAGSAQQAPLLMPAPAPPSAPTEAAPTAAAPTAAEPPAPAPLIPAPAPQPEAFELTPQFVEPVVEPVIEPVDEPSYASTAGHWSRQAALDDETQPFENTLSREVGRGNVSTTTNALVLPTTSQLNDIASAINSTGEILVTGSITLPSALGSTGGDSRRYDDPDVDALFDAYDNELVATDSAPVSAIHAVSTHTSTHGVITAPKPTGNRMLTGLMIATGVMGVAAFGLLVAGFVLNIF